MAKSYSYPFDIESDLNGVRVIVTREPLCPGCQSDGDIDSHIDAMKEQLELLRSKMKAEIKRLRNTTLGLRITPLDDSAAG